jgi:putative FmdB family regulatory protein
MPTYQYACTDPECGNRFELVQSFTDPSASTCPVCQHAVRKVYGSVGVVFKGSGFYRNDSRAAAMSAESASNSSSDSSESKSESKSETKTESKSETKTESKSDAKSDSKPAAKSSSSSNAAAASA